MFVYLPIEIADEPVYSDGALPDDITRVVVGTQFIETRLVYVSIEFFKQII